VLLFTNESNEDKLNSIISLRLSFERLVGKTEIGLGFKYLKNLRLNSEENDFSSLLLFDSSV